MDSTSTKLGASAVQSIDRAADILRAVSKHSATGAKLADVVGETGLTRATAHRLLQALVATRLLEQDTVASRYFLGVWLIHLSEQASERFGLERLTLQSRARLSERTGDTIFLTTRIGASMICSARTEGSFPVKVLTLEVGSTRPLGVGAGGLAIMAFLSEAEQKLVLKACADQYSRFNLDRDRVAALCAEARKHGYSIDRNIVLPGVTGVGIPLRGPDGEIVASLSIAAISERMTEDRIEEVGALLKEEAETLAALMKSTDHRTGTLG
ncbi:IclR family transcriptional regulator [Pseudohoeflea coraliihabitans]|uniref:IclR family transcriptional regulator n=1 Tax=Pseudohoeflea coraliihabitans TaxID=2860393 RepID=A0ABS6WND4_9HYPH|nr:IclR family transcriptional regulator [Pseudohoeflea sp. DP4N28-3]MBW3097173.1 IclR family transcriptional regulator [Pseudohoeflea sp. DP4N28-3]